MTPHILTAARVYQLSETNWSPIGALQRIHQIWCDNGQTDNQVNGLMICPETTAQHLVAIPGAGSAGLEPRPHQAHAAECPGAPALPSPLPASHQAGKLLGSMQQALPDPAGAQTACLQPRSLTQKLGQLDLVAVGGTVRQRADAAAVLLWCLNRACDGSRAGAIGCFGAAEAEAEAG